MIKKIAVIGGDKRSLFAARELMLRGIEVELAGFDNLLSYGELVLKDTKDALTGADAVLLPITGVKNGVVNCPFSDENIVIEDNMLCDKLVFTGRTDYIKCGKLFNIAARDDFKTANALPTAEGAVQVAMESYESVIHGSRCLVIGYGRIGSCLSSLLEALDADVTVSTRSGGDKVKSIPDCFNIIYTEKLQSLDGYDIVFNTADKLIVTADILGKTADDPLIIDLASLPGGVDFDAAEKLGFTAIRALALPGKCSPAAAGRIISDIILNILQKEESYCQT